MTGFPEVARELSNRGAEIIAWPVWGCNPEQARARACENRVYLVSSTYEDVSRDWMLTAVYGEDGSVIAQAVDGGKGLSGSENGRSADGETALMLTIVGPPRLRTPHREWVEELKAKVPSGTR